MTPRLIPAGKVSPSEYAPAGEAQGSGETFTAEQIAAAFEVAVGRVERALAGEFGLGPEARVDSRQAQQLAEVLLVSQPLADRLAALMRLGAYTPRPDQEWGFGEKAPGEESDRLGP
jgi:hypothetical protein